MSTKCLIATSDANDFYFSCFCLHDGYPTYTGKILLDFFNDTDSVAELIEYGGFSSIKYINDKTAVKVFEPINIDGFAVDVKFFENILELKSYFLQSDYSYLYIWNTTKEEWTYFTKEISKDFSNNFVGYFVSNEKELTEKNTGIAYDS